MRSFWASLVVLCVLAVPVRPSDAEIREHDASSTVGVASRHGVVTPMFRRSGVPYVHAHAPFVAPDIGTEPPAPRLYALVSLDGAAHAPHCSFVPTRTSRGPPPS